MVDPGLTKPRVAVTGAGGLLGWHIVTRLRARGIGDVHAAGREAFADAQSLDRLVTQCPVIVHCAGANRGADDEVAATNISLAERLVAACRRTGHRPYVIFADSIQRDHDTAYGRSKRRAGEIFREWARVEGGGFTDLILPHVFGEHGRPFYNSVVSTFCYQLAHGQEPTIVDDGHLELVHAGDVADRIEELVCRYHGLSAAEIGTEERVAGKPMRVSEMLARLQQIASTYRQFFIPDVREAFDLRLFNTYRSYLFPQAYPVPVKRITDDRGWLCEAIKETGGGQGFLSETHPGIVRGNHFHLRKFERFLVVRGEGCIAVRRVGMSAVQSFQVSGMAPAFIDMPTLHTHNITNIGREPLLTLFWTNEIFDPSDPDTYPDPI